MGTITEPARQVPVVADCDVCVVGGSATGVFAAVAAARLGAKVAIIESNGFFGGVATASLVNLWHSTEDMQNQQQIIAGLTTEVFERLDRRGGLTVVKGKRTHYALNTEELKIELDVLITEAEVRPFLHTMFVAPVVEDGRMVAAIIEDKTGRRAIRAKQFIDATGDADVVARMGLPVYQREQVQPPTMCVILRGLDAIRKKHPGFNVHRVIFDTQYPQALKPGFAWGQSVPGGNDEYMLAGTRVFNANCSDADELTAATIEGRRQVRAICDILRENFMDGQGTPLVTLPAKIGIRESRHARCLHTLTQDELLSGHRFPDAIGNGTYPVDIHNARGGGITFRHLEKAPFYQIPYSSLVPQGAPQRPDRRAEHRRRRGGVRRRAGHDQLQSDRPGRRGGRLARAGFGQVRRRDRYGPAPRDAQETRRGDSVSQAASGRSITRRHGRCMAKRLIRVQAASRCC